jgi:trimeric autotransporter adhesin
MKYTKHARIWFVLLSSFILHPSSFLLAQIPQLISYQGRIVDGTNLVNGTIGSMYLYLYNDPSGGALLYVDETFALPVVDGLYSTFIGDGTLAGNLETALTNAEVWLEVQVNGTTLTPRERIGSVMYALRTHGLLITTNNAVILNHPEGSNSVAASARNAVISGGIANTIGDAWNTVIGGGGNNSITNISDYSVIGGGRYHTIRENASFASIGGGYSNVVGTDADYAFIGGGRLNSIETDAQNASIAGGTINTIDRDADHSVIGGGSHNLIGEVTIGAVVAGGHGNSIGDTIVDDDNSYSVIGGGVSNSIFGFSKRAIIAGGSTNSIFGSNEAVIGGGSENDIGQFSDATTISGGSGNYIDGNSQWSFIGGGRFNMIQFASHGAVVVGGQGNIISTNADYSVVGGGFQNDVERSASFAVIGGGIANIIGAQSTNAVIGGGQDNVILDNGIYATIPGGQMNDATNYAFAAGRRAKAVHAGSFVWGDNLNSNVTSSASNQVTFRSTGGFRIFTSSALTSGVQVAANSGAWTSISDVNAKEAFAPVDAMNVLEKVIQLPITTWRYKGQDREIRHMGPTAQDFHAAFGLGDAPGYGITTIDADGVALAAIQALAKENAELKAELDAIKKKLGM